MWLFLTACLDVFPWLYLLVLPFRGRTRVPWAGVLLLGLFLPLSHQLGFVRIAELTNCDLNEMLIYRMMQVVELLALTMLLLKDRPAKLLFVFCLILPGVMLVLALACFIMTFIPDTGAPPFCVPALLRLLITAAVFPSIFRIWKERFIPVLNRRMDFAWNYLCPIPASLTLISLFFTENNFEIAGVDLGEVLGRGAVFFGVVAVCILLLKSMEQMERHLQALEQARVGTMLLELQSEQYKTMVESIEQTRKLRHDLRHHMTTVSTLAAQGRLQELQDYASQFSLSPQVGDLPVLCRNFAVNAIAGDCAARARELGIHTDVRLDVPPDVAVQDIDLCIVVGNLMENALEACLTLPPGERWLKVRARTCAYKFYLTVANSCGEAPRQKDGVYLSRRRGYRTGGVGIASVSAVAGQYGGELTLEAEEGVFKASIFLEANTQKEAE